MNRSTKLAALVAVILSAVSCTGLLETEPSGPEVGQEKIKLTVVPSIKGLEPATKSSITSGEESVKDINIYFYHDGKLVTSGYYTLPGVVTFLLNEGIEFNVYAIANAGRIAAEDKETDFLKYRYEIDSRGYVAQMNGDGFPLVWKKEGFTLSKTTPQLNITLTRLVSKIRFSVEKDALAGLKITSVRLFNGAGAVTPFIDNGHGGSKVTKATETVDGDYASTSDLQKLNSGDQVCFYALENCQGTLLTGNKDPWKKTPENISAADLCTYLEVGCEFQTGFALNGTIVYRVYLGQDNCTNFDIIRNVDMGVTLCLTKNLDNVSWKIDPDVNYNGSLGEAWIEQGFHSMDNLYVGETVKLGLYFNEYLEDFLGKGLNGCRLAVVMEDEINPDFKFGDLVYSSGDYFCDMKCYEKTSYPCELWLVDRDGNMITDISLENGEIDSYEPYLTVGDGAVKRPADKITAPQHNTCPIVNGTDDKVYLYLTDYRGSNLNVPQSQGQYGFDLSLFERLAMRVSTSEPAAAKLSSAASDVLAKSYILQGINQGTNQNGGPAFTCTIRNTNAGTNATLNDAFSKVYHMTDYHDGGNYIADLYFSAEKTNPTMAMADFGIVKPKFYLADRSTFQPSNGYSINGTNFVCAYNPSKIDYWADVIYVGRRKASTTSSKIDGTSLINFRSGATNPSYYIPTAVRTYAYPYIADCSSAVLKHTAPTARDIVIEGKPCMVYATDMVGSVAQLSETDGNKDFMRAEVGIRSMGGRDIDYDYEDLNGAFVKMDGSIGTSAEYDYVWGDNTYSYRGCGWYTGDGMKTTINANKDVNIASVANYTGANVYSLMMRKPVKFTITWDTASKCPVVNMTGNTYGTQFKVYVGLVYTSSCTTANNTSASSSTHTYTVNVPEKNTTVPSYVYNLSGESASANLPNYVTLESKFAQINKTYWHENCTNAINLKSNRFSQLAMPESIEYAITITVDDKDLWVPVDITATAPTGSIQTIAYTFFTHTARGTYADTSSMTNPDGSSRGSDSNVSSQAAKYGDYSSTTGSYKVKFTILHDQYWNWYNM